MKKLLFLDDRAEYRELIVEGARRRGYQSEGVATALETLQELRVRRYDALIIDPSDDGLVEGKSCLSSIVRREFPDMIIIALTGHTATFFDTLAKDSYDVILGKRNYDTMGSLFYSLSGVIDK